jgi:hypothetical protein
MELRLLRSYYPHGTNGTLYLAGEKICCTIELPWKENQQRISCIPEGRYELKKRYTPRFGYHLLVRDVPGRSNILIHAFNNALEESKGCIATVSHCTGEGVGTFARITLQKLVHTVYPELDKKKPVFLTIIKEK